jgi:uncharacterized protein YutE (UPF0331/DUF86 family)
MVSHLNLKNRFAALENLDNNIDFNMVWESNRQPVKSQRMRILIFINQSSMDYGLMINIKIIR